MTEPEIVERVPPELIPFGEEPEGFYLGWGMRGCYAGWRYGYQSPCKRTGVEARWVRLERMEPSMSDPHNDPSSELWDLSGPGSGVGRG